MKVSAALLLYSAVAGVFGPALMRRLQDPSHSPRTALGLWLSLDASILLSLTFAALAPVAGTKPISDGLVSLLSACLLTLTGSYTGTSDTGQHLVVAGIGWSALVALATLVGFGIVRASRFARRHAGKLGSTAKFRLDHDVWVLDHDDPLVYCVPGRSGGIVVTSAALVLLSSPELDAVIAHERAHLRGRHPLFLVITDGLRRCLGWIPSVRVAAQEVAQLVELLADDAASRRTNGRVVAQALLALSHRPTPDGTLAATANLTALRVARLLGPPLPRLWRSHLAAWTAVAATLTVPALIAILPAALGINADYCPGGLSTVASASTYPNTSAYQRNTH